MIEVKQLSKSFGKNKILDNISFSAENGHIYGLVGYNGVGKTTLMRIISGIYRSDGGTVLSDGSPVYENPSVKQECFFMTEEAPFFDGFSMDKMRKFYRRYYPKWNDDTYISLVNWFGLDPQQKVGSFSKGMLRQASLTMAFSSRAGILLLDEAFDGLDEAIRKSLGEMLRFYCDKQKAVIIISSHNLRELENIADDIGLLDNGKLTFNASVRSLHEDYGMNLEELFCRGRVINDINWEEVFK